MIDYKEHPYRKFVATDVIRHTVYQDAVRDNLTYFNVIPRLYKSMDIINPIDYKTSAYVRFLEESFNAYYSVTIAFGINVYMQVAFLKCEEDGDFTSEEIEEPNKKYIYVANSYKNFKKHELAKIVWNIQSEIISTDEKSYLVTDDFMNLMSYNKTAETYLKEILGPFITEQFSTTTPFSWLPFLLGEDEDKEIYTYDQSYLNVL